MSLESWLVNLVYIAITILATYLAIKKVLPMLKDFLAGFLKEKPLAGVMSLITVAVLVTALDLIMGFIKAIGDKTLSYLVVLTPIITVLKDLIDQIKWLVLVGVLVMGLVEYKKAK